MVSENKEVIPYKNFFIFDSKLKQAPSLYRGDHRLSEYIEFYMETFNQFK